MRRRRPLTLTVAVLYLVSALFSAPSTAAAASFNPQYIISDDEMRRSDAMSFADISKFLHEKGGFGDQYDIDAIDGLLKGTAQLIDDAAKRYRINPKYILALIQKESGAIETGTPTQKQLDWATGYALCDGCSRQNSLAQKYKGLAKQIDAGAGWMDWYLTKAPVTPSMLQVGETRTISMTKVTPVNWVTAALYTYTPHLHGNRLLWSIWNRWFGSGVLPQFPDGTLVRNETNGAVALIQGGKFRPIVSASVLETRFRNNNIIDLNEYDFQDLQNLMPGRPVQFPDLSLVRTETGDTYLLVGAQRRLIVSPEVFSKIGFNPEEVEDIKASDIEDYLDGVSITLDSASPFGELLQNRLTGGVYFVQNGVKQPIWDRAIMIANFNGQKIVPTDPETLSGLTDGEPVKLIDGVLVKTPDDPAVYVISNGRKRSIPSEEVFLSFGYRWPMILTVSPRALELHETGEPLLILDSKVTAAAVGI